MRSWIKMNCQKILVLITFPVVVRLTTVYRLYFEHGQRVNISCQITNATWTGPPKSDILAVGMDLAKGMSSNFSITISNSTSVLTIKMFAKTNEGLYSCYNFVTNCSFYLSEKPNQNALTISNTHHNGTIMFRENEELTLECKIVLEKTFMMLKWIYNETIVSSTNTSVLHYTFNTTMDFDGAVYTCKACDDSNMTVLSQSISLKVCVTEEHGTFQLSSSTSFRYYAFLAIPIVVIFGVVLYVLTRGKQLQEEITGCLKIRNRDQHGQNDIVDVGPGAIANDMYGHPQNPPPRGQNDVVQVYSSFDRRQNITLSSHAHAVSYDVRAKTRPDRTRKKKVKAKENNGDPTNTTGQNSASAIETQEHHGLYYVEVTFDSKTEANKLRIPGQQHKTDYVDIDFTKKLRTMPTPKDNDDSDETAYEVNKMKRKTHLQE